MTISQFSRWQRFAFICATLFLVTFSIRIGYVFSTKTYLSADQAEVEYIASNLADGKGFSSPFGGSTGPTAHTAPGYPWALSMAYRLVGADLTERRLLQQILSSLITSLSVSLVPLVAIHVGLPFFVGVLASGLLSVIPFQLWVETSGAFEQPVSALLLLLSLLSLGMHSVLPRGFLLGVTALTSPSIVLVPLAFVFKGMLRNSKCIISECKVLLIAAIIVSPWLVRNYLTFDGFIGIRSNFGLEFFLGNNASADGRSFQGSWKRKDSFFSMNHPLSSKQEYWAYKSIGEIQYNRAKFETARAWIENNPAEFASLSFRRAMLFFFPSPSLWSESVSAREFRALLFSSISVLSFFGVLSLILRKSTYAPELLATIVLPGIPYFLTHVDPRYRYPIMCIATLLAVDFLVRMGEVGVRLFRGSAENGEQKS